MELILSPRRVLVTLLVIIGLLVVASSAGVAWYLHYLPEKLPLLVNLFNVNAEANVPTFFSALLLFASSVLLAVVGSGHRARRESFIPWRALAVLFLFMAVDEVVSLHEQLSFWLQGHMHTSGYFYFAWVIPYGIATTAIVILFSRFLFRLPTRTRVLFILAGTTYVAGALGFEMLSGNYIRPGASDAGFAVLYTFEESLEMLGITFFIYALLDYIGVQFGAVRCTVEGNR
jgi:hypothetical protein